MDYRTYINYINDYIELGCSEEQLLGQIGFPPDIDLTAESLIKAVSIIGAAADGSIKRLVELAGVSLRAFAAKYRIPYRTVQDWVSSSRTPPDYIPVLVGFEMITELPLHQ